MKPINFKQANKTLYPSGKKYPEDVVEVVPIGVWTDGEQCITCWNPSLRERLAILLFGRVWLSLLSGNSMPPVAILGEKDHFAKMDAMPAPPKGGE